MLAPPLTEISLGQRSLYRIADGKGHKVLCLRGAIWLTQEGDRRDIVLTAGESFTLDRAGLAVLYALSAASATILSRTPRLPQTIDIPGPEARL